MEASNRLLIDSTDSLQEIEARITSRDFEAVHHPERGPTVRKVLEELLAVLDANSPDGVILSAWFPALLWAPAGFSPGGWGVAESGRCRRPVSTPCPLNSPRCTGLPGGACDGPPRRPPLLPSPRSEGSPTQKEARPCHRTPKPPPSTRSSTWARSWPPLEPFAPRTRRRTIRPSCRANASCRPMRLTRASPPR